MIRQAELIFTSARLVDSDESSQNLTLYQATGGVPLLWIFLFGGRNVWDPGDDAHARGGAVGQREAYETPIDVAMTRLEYATAAMEGDPYAWPWYSMLPILKRKLHLQSKGGFLRLQAHWEVTPTADASEKWRSAPALVENFVNLMGASRAEEAAISIERLRDLLLFVPIGSEQDRTAFRKSPHFKGEEDAIRACLLMLGEPPGRARELLIQAARKYVAPSLEAHMATTGRRPKPAGSATAGSDPLLPAGAPTPPPGMLRKLTGFFGRRAN